MIYCTLLCLYGLNLFIIFVSLKWWCDVLTCNFVWHHIITLSIDGEISKQFLKNFRRSFPSFSPDMLPIYINTCHHHPQRVNNLKINVQGAQLYRMVVY